MTTETTREKTPELKQCDQCGKDIGFDKGLCASCENNTCSVWKSSTWDYEICGKPAKGWMLGSIYGSNDAAARAILSDTTGTIGDGCDLYLMCGFHMSIILREANKIVAWQENQVALDKKIAELDAQEKRSNNLIRMIQKLHPDVAPSLWVWRGDSVSINIDELVALVCEKETPHDG